MTIHTRPVPGAEPVRTTDAPAGLLSGTPILTMDGELPVEHLTPGDRVITRDAGLAILRGVERREVRVRPVRIKAGSLGHTRPDRDLRVGPGTQIHVRDWRAQALYGQAAAAVPAEALADGEFVTVEGERRLALHRLVFDRAHIVYAGGLEVVAS